MKIIRHREIVESVTYSHSFFWKGQPGSGFSFPCNEAGELEGIHPAGMENLAKCLFGEYCNQVDYDGIEKQEHHYTEPAIGICRCGCEVVLDGFTNTCEGCGRDYNMSGQELADRSQWGEETGEHYSDILRIP